jgi:5-methylcytosine-specific restriction endonuclease McrA
MTKKQKDKLREKARRKYLEILMHCQDNKCHYCHCDLIIRPVDAYMKGNYCYNEKTHEPVGIYATIDHIIPLREKHDNHNDRSNLVVCCMKCNNQKDNSFNPLPKQRICNVCGIIFLKHKSSNKLCVDCCQWRYELDMAVLSSAIS